LPTKPSNRALNDKSGDAPGPAKPRRMMMARHCICEVSLGKRQEYERHLAPFIAGVGDLLD
jgi:hypothetical protein